MPFDPEFPDNIKKFSTKPKDLLFRSDLTDEERSFIKRIHISTSIGHIIISVIFLGACFFVMNYLSGLHVVSQDGAESPSLHYFGIGVFVLGIVTVLRVILGLIITKYGICDNGIIVRTFTKAYVSNDETGSVSYTEYVSVWFPDNRQYCPQIRYRQTHGEFNTLKQGDKVIVFRISNKHIYAVTNQK